MNQQEFVIGQRWVSNTEAELGLGLVLEADERQVVFSFPAAGERRTYAVRNAPVSRVRFQVDETVNHQDGTRIVVEEVLEQGALLAYQGRTAEGEEKLIPEFELDSFVRFSTPRERLFSGQIDKNSHFGLRQQSLETWYRQRRDPAFGLCGPRIEPLEHQLSIAAEVGKRLSPRVLLADEVGLGKTIEAGLILHQQWLAGRVRRALLVVPETLQHQWLVEMLRRFNLPFSLLDEQRCRDMSSLEDIDPALLPDEDEVVIAEADDNPFESDQLILCSLEFLTDNAKRQQQALEADWDMLLVDEAHHLQWHDGEPGPAYQCIEGLAHRADGVLLLTATPEQLGLESHFARLRLLDPDRYSDLDRFLSEQDGYRALSETVEALHEVRQKKASDWPESLEPALAEYLSSAAIAKLREQAERSPEAALDRAIDWLLDRYGTGRVLFRNTRESVAGFPERKLHTHPLELDDDALLALGESPLTEQLYPEHFWPAHTGTDWWEADPRVEWLIDFLKQRRGEKVLVIAASADTAQALELHLRVRKGLASAVFHEGLTLLERDRAAAYFADHEAGAQVLICSEIGSEGRNFQFARGLVLFDLPLNPDLLEQRIGRLDRIGQAADTISIHLPYASDTAQEQLMLWYHRGLNAFEQPCAFGQSLYQEQADPLPAALTGAGDTDFDELLEQTRERARQWRERMREGRDRLLELNSCRPERAAPLMRALEGADNGPELMAYLERVFDAFGVDHEELDEHSWVVRPSEQMRVSSFPGLSEDGMTATFDRAQALSREDMAFMSWEHPLVLGAQEMIVQGEFGNTALATLKLPKLKPGTLLLEALFVLHCPAPESLQLERFVPNAMRRVLLDAEGRDLSGALAAGKLDALLKKVPRPSAQDLVRHARAQLADMMERAETLVAPDRETMVEQAHESLRESLEPELDRLRALAEVNPNVREGEIAALEARLSESQACLDRAQLRLDAVRVIMTV